MADLPIGRAVAASESNPIASLRAPLLRIPPFPGARRQSFIEKPVAIERPGSTVDVRAVMAAMRELRVGGTYWGPQPALPKGCVLVRCATAPDRIAAAIPEEELIKWGAAAVLDDGADEARSIGDDCDPWHVLSGAKALVADVDDEVLLIAALLDVPCYSWDPEAESLRSVGIDAEAAVAERLCDSALENPFTGEVTDALAAVELCAFWRRLIDSNRGIEGGIGFAFWKQSHVAPLLWSGSSPFRFLRAAGGIKAGDSVAVWRAKASDAVIGELQLANISAVEVEDGFLRSRGLGANCVPPLSITVDRLGAHFDPSQPSELEELLENGFFDQRLIDRARELRRLIVEAAIGKYERGGEAISRRAGERRHILVPGQVEDDRAVIAGGCGLVSNLDLLRRVREHSPDSYILYKPHPDVLAGHRCGAISDRTGLQFADEIVGELAIASLIDMVDEVHVNTSLAGFEALLRDKLVTTHGVPFYAGWGLTRDLGPVPDRRTRKLTIDQMVAAALLLYPRYFDPVAGLPCPAEIVVARLSVIEDAGDNFIVGMRRLQGKFMRRLRSLVQ